MQNVYSILESETVTQTILPCRWLRLTDDSLALEYSARASLPLAYTVIGTVAFTEEIDINEG